jgi:pilus assembly protein CpaF
MLQAMNTGHAGSMTTIHANSARDAVGRLEMLVGMSGFDLPMWLIQRQIASAINLVVHCARLDGGQRKVVHVAEITGSEGEVITMHDLFRFEQTGVDEKGSATGHFVATGIIPHCIDRLKANGCRIPSGLFEGRELIVDRIDRARFGG